jgi:hypothetical protein
MLDRVCARVFMAGGAALAATVANCTRVLIHGLLPVVLVLLHSRAMRCFRRRSSVADVVGTLVGLVAGSGVSALVGIVVYALILLLITLLMAENGTLFPETELCFPFCESGSDLLAGDGSMFPETELCFLFCESESDLPAGNRTLFPEAELCFLICESDIALVIR